MNDLSMQAFHLQKKGAFGTVALATGIAGLLLSVAGLLTDADRFFFSWHVAFGFWTTLALGALFFTMLHHVTGAVWSIVLRRAAEALSMTLPVLFLFFLPVLFGAHSLFEWSRGDLVAQDKVLTAKAPYLNLGFFAARGVAYFLIWTLLAWFLNRYSLRMDALYDPAAARKMRNLSAGGMFLFAFSLTFAGFDWFMSLHPHWYSTMFGVNIYAASFLAFINFLAFFSLYLRARGAGTDFITIEHYHDLGRMMFAFVVFWAYIGGGQYFLIWYTNLPEETIWYLQRWDYRSWRLVSLSLIFLHFALPFLVLAFYGLKRKLWVIRSMAGLMLAMHYVFMYWLIMPSHFKRVSIHWLDVATLLGIGGIVCWLFYRRYARLPLVPLRDPNLADSIAHRV